MPYIPSSHALRNAAEQQVGRQNQLNQRWERWGVRRHFARALGQEGADSTARSLIIVGITCGTIAAVVVIGILIYLIVRHRRRHQNQHQQRSRHSVPTSSTIRNGYNRARTESKATDNSRRSRSTKKRSSGDSRMSKHPSFGVYAHVPMLEITLSTNSPPARHQSGYRYDPDPAGELPRHKESRRKETMARLKLNTSLLAPSPRLESLSPTNPNRPSTLLMQSATSPPPFAQYFPVGQPIRPRAELRVGNTPVDEPVNLKQARHGAVGVGGLGSFVPPPPPSWASFWPTESGWTGPGGPPSIRDEDFGSDSDASFDSDDEKKPALEGIMVEDESDSDMEEGQYALDARTEGHAYGPFRLTPKKHQGPGRTSMDRETTNEPDNVSLVLPSSPSPLQRSPRLDLGEDLTDLPDEDSIQPTDGHPSLVRGATGKFTLAFGHTRSNTNVTGSGRITRTSTGQTEFTGSSGTRRSSARSKGSSGRLGRSGTRVTRSSTMKTDRTDMTDQSISAASTVSGQILSALSGHVAMPLIRSMNSLRRVGGYLGTGSSSTENARGGQGDNTEGSASAFEAGGREPAESSALLDDQSPSRTTSPPQSTTPVRRLPPLPSPPPVPPIPRHHATAPAVLRPLPIPNSPPLSPRLANISAVQSSIPRAASLTLSSAPPNRPSHMSPSLERSVSASTPLAVRPLPAPPVPTL
ncbi:hypothetical protein BDV93DRAFT_609898 [Ceratobasidium sp. AG-I]|nr:hypothetical protein BDV93DRAFT_609898 [Ceratobasidium sp. AG-I]